MSTYDYRVLDSLLAIVNEVAEPGDPAMNGMRTIRRGITAEARDALGRLHALRGMEVALDAETGPEDRRLTPAEWSRAFRRMHALEEMGWSIPSIMFATSEEYNAEDHARMLLDDENVRTWNRSVFESDRSGRVFEDMLKKTGGPE